MINERDIEADVLRKLTIPKMEVPPSDSWEGALTKKELEEFKPEYQPILFAISKLDQKSDFSIEKAVECNSHLRKLEATIIRQQSLRYRAFGWVVMTILTGIFVVIGQMIAAAIFK